MPVQIVVGLYRIDRRGGFRHVWESEESVIVAGSAGVYSNVIANLGFNKSYSSNTRSKTQRTRGH
jgi:hypothetical protein